MWRFIRSGAPLRPYDRRHLQATTGSREVGLQCGRIAAAPVRIIDNADKVVDVGHLFVTRGVDSQLVDDFLLTQACPGHLGFDDQTLAGQKEVHARSVAAIARCPLLRPDVVKVKFQDRVQQILHVGAPGSVDAFGGARRTAEICGKDQPHVPQDHPWQ